MNFCRFGVLFLCSYMTLPLYALVTQVLQICWKLAFSSSELNSSNAKKILQVQVAQVLTSLKKKKKSSHNGWWSLTTIKLINTFRWVQIWRNQSLKNKQAMPLRIGIWLRKRGTRKEGSLPLRTWMEVEVQAQPLLGAHCTDSKLLDDTRPAHMAPRTRKFCLIWKPRHWHHRQPPITGF